MANSDETCKRLKGIDTKQFMFKEAILDYNPQWYLQPSKYPNRVGNDFEPYLSGEAVFKQLAASIDNAKYSIDILTLGFDPAFPMMREDKVYQQTMALEEHGFFDWILGKEKPKPFYVDRDRLTTEQRQAYFDGKLKLFSGWKREDAYGEHLINALRNNKNLKVRIVLWWYPLNTKIGKIQTSTGLYPWSADQRWVRTLMTTGYTEEKFGKELKDLLLRDRHPDAQYYSNEWFYRLLCENEKGMSDDDPKNPFNRIGVAFRNIGHLPFLEGIAEEDNPAFQEKLLLKIANTDHQKTVLIDVDEPEGANNAHGYVMGHNSTTGYWSAFPFEHRDLRNEMDGRPYHDFSIRVKGPLVADLSQNFVDAWTKQRRGELEMSRILKLDKSDQWRTEQNIKPNKLKWDNPVLGERPRVSKIFDKDSEAEFLKTRKAAHLKIIKSTAGDSEGQIVRTRVDEKFCGEPEKEIKNAYLRAMQQMRNYLLIVNQYVQYPLVVRHLKYWWLKYKDQRQIYGAPLPKSENLYIFMGTARMELDNAVWRAHQMANELGCGDQFPKAEKDMYETPEEAQKKVDAIPVDAPYADQYLLQQYKINETRRIKNEQETIKQQRDQRHAEEKEVAKAAAEEKRKNNPNAVEEPIPEPTPYELQADDKVRTLAGSGMGAGVHVSKGEIEEYQIKPLFFMFYTQIEPDGGSIESRTAQQPYVHAKLYVQDDVFFTLGSANLSVRSMAADSELNLISDERKVARKYRHDLWAAYTGYPDEAIERKKLKNAKLAEQFTPAMEQAIRDEFPNNEFAELTQIELAKIHERFEEVMEDNHKRIPKNEVIQGCISTFQEDRPGTAVRRA